MMRTLKNKELSFKRMKISINPEKNETTIIETMSSSNYFKQILDILNHPPQEGWNKANIPDLRSRLSLIRKLENAIQKKTKAIKIEEVEFIQLEKASDNFGFVVTSEEVADFFDYITNLPVDKQ